MSDEINEELQEQPETDAAVAAEPTAEETAERIVHFWAERVRTAQAVVLVIQGDEGNLKDAGLPTIDGVLQAMCTYEHAARLLNLHHQVQVDLIERQEAAVRKLQEQAKGKGSGLALPPHIAAQLNNGNAEPPGFGKGPRRGK
jgi:hypothetical protein